MRNLTRPFVFLLLATIVVAAGCGGGGRRGTSSTAAVTPASTAPTTTQTRTTPPTTVTPTTPPPTTVTPPVTTTPPATTTNPHLLYALNLINAQRQLRGLPLFVLDPALSACALRHSINWDAASANNIASAPLTAHRDFKLGDLCGAEAENQGVGQGPIDPAFKTVFESMMNEGTPKPGECNHYGNLMNPLYTRIGIGIYEDNGNVWITEMFAR